MSPEKEKQAEIGNYKKKSLKMGGKEITKSQ